ncbi:MAG: hypothetical protein JNL58_31655 [Planctomyces sp.]|nr:hypothetical protein [Planctomyces sp.]
MLLLLRQCAGMWLNDHNAIIGLSKLMQLPTNSAVNKRLRKKPDVKQSPAA